MPAMSVENIKQHGRRAASLLLLQTFCNFTEPSGGAGERGKSGLSSGLLLDVGARNQRWTSPTFDIRLVQILGGHAESNTELIRISQLTN
jgi:hypothetical protein